MKREEITGKRSSNIKVFEDQNHLHTVEIYLNPVHYQDENGDWKEMDDSLKEVKALGDEKRNTTELMVSMMEEEKSEVDFINKKGEFEIFLKKIATTDSLATLKQGKNRISWTVKNSNITKAVKKDEHTVGYQDILPGVDLHCHISGMSIKEDIILKKRNAEKSYTYLYQVEGLTPVQKGKNVLFYDKNEKEIFCIQAPYMRDAAGVRSENIEMSVKMFSGEDYSITFIPDRKWLEAEERVYPIVIDPVTTTSREATDIEDAYISSRYETDNFYNNENLWLRGGNEICRSFLKFKLPELQSGDILVKARLVLVSLGETGEEKTIAVHRVIQSWESRNINWHNKPIYEETVQDLCKFTADKIKYVTMDITRMVKEWYRDGSNNGLMLKEFNELAGSVKLMSSDWDSSLSDYRPKVEISYVNYSGLEDYWTYHSQKIGRAGTVHVNDYNGNLIMEHPIMASGGSRMPIELSLIYNTNDKDTDIGYGRGIRLNYHQRLNKKIIAGTTYYVHTDADGTVHYFVEREVEKDGTKEKVWKEENGLDLILIRAINTEEPYVIKDKKGTGLVFDSSGLLVAIKDKNKNKLTITYDNKRIKTVTDGSGRVFMLTYSKDSSGEVRLAKVMSPTGEKKTFAYTGENLTSVVDVDGKRIGYTYDSNGLLTSAVDINGYQVKYTYYTKAPYRVKTITEYAGTEKGGSLSLKYGYNSTSFTDHKKRTEIYRFDNSGNLLHIHDEFGHAASGRYNRDGNHVNRLESATKLQDNIVQLLKNPIIQEKNVGWKVQISPKDAGTAEIEKDAENCMIGDNALKAECVSLTGYVYWGQDVQVKKGQTYTASVYMKVDITETADDGGAFLRVKYKDKDGEQHWVNSEILKNSTNGFVRLVTTFTVPVNADSDIVRIYILVKHAKAVMYADMAQLETGTTANRCNLIDNGDFHLENTRGFSKKGSAVDGITMVGTAENIPAQNALVVTASSTGVLRKTPSEDGAVAVSLTRNQHLTGHIVTKQNGRNWYYAQTVDGTNGYVSTSHAIPYLGGNEGANSGAVAVSNAILYAKADKTASRVQEGIYKGTCVTLVKTVKDADGNTWYYIGMQMEAVRYFGYMPTSDIIRLCRNTTKMKAKKDTGYYELRSTSKAAAGIITAGTSMAFRGLSVDATGKEWMVIRRGKDFYFVPSEDMEIKTAGIYGRLSGFTVEDAVNGLDDSIYRFIGEPDKDKKLVRTLDISGKKGDIYIVNAWGLGTALPETENDTKRRFGTEVIFVAEDGSTDIHYANFSPDVHNWQFLSDVCVAKKNYSSIQVAYTYCHNANMAYFDGLALYRENFGKSYTYDKENNLVSVADLQGQTTKFEYNSQDDLTGVVDARGNKFKYEYDDEKTTRNVIRGISAQNVVYRFTYDAAGNVLKSACVDPAAQNVGTWMTRAMTSDKNHVKSVTDANNNTIRYTWDLEKDLLTTLQDARGNKITYTYDEVKRLLSAAQSVTVDGTKRTIRNSYTYTNDDLIKITHNEFEYGFTYDAFGNVKNASIADMEVVAYEYEANNGRLLKASYGNGGYVRYTYDKQDRITQSYFKDPTDNEEQKLCAYVYDKQGNLCTVKSDATGKTYNMFYDFLDRLIRVTDEQGNAYEYTYDANNNMMFMVHICGKSALRTTYTYDKDSREVNTRCAVSYERTTSYDKFGRVSKRSWNTTIPYVSAYTYIENGDNRYELLEKIKNGSNSISYTYDANGNIISIRDEEAQSRFYYDELNQMVREDNHQLNKTIVYTYDLGGNLTAIREYAFTTAEILPEIPEKIEIGIYDSKWKDQLLNWNGIVMTYDTIGNMLTRGDIRYTWTQGRKLSGVENGKSIRYFYNHAGVRVKKTVDGTDTEYRWAGDLLLSEKTGTQTMWYRYDSAAVLVSVTIKGKIYFYIRNAQNDIIALVDADGKEVVKYKYDSWGKVLSISGELADTVGVQNPFRYKGYYYDNETEMYYLKTRYYAAEIRRFICADGVHNKEAVLGHNLYLYCYNNPIIYSDLDGTCPYNGTAADFHRAEQGLPPLNCNCLSKQGNTRKNPVMIPRKDKRKGSDNRQKSGARERNVAHPNGEEHSRVPKGNRVTRIEAAIGVLATTVGIIVLIADDVTGIGVADNWMLSPTVMLWWDFAEMLF